jgi:hypothetical protein
MPAAISLLTQADGIAQIETNTAPSELNNPPLHIYLWYQVFHFTEQFKNFQFNVDELAIAFSKSFLTAFLKKSSIDELNQYLQIEKSFIKKTIFEVIMILSFSILCAQFFGYSFFFSLAMESTNHILRRTGNAHWTMLSSPAFYAPGIIINMINREKSASTSIIELTERLMRSSASGLGGLLGWFLAVIFTPGPHVKNAQKEKVDASSIKKLQATKTESKDAYGYYQQSFS